MFNEFDSFSFGEHQIPDGASLMEIKQCENCTATFVRRRCTHPKMQRCGCIKFCGPCCGRQLASPVSEIEFNNELRDVMPEKSKHEIRNREDNRPPGYQQGKPADPAWEYKLLLAFMNSESLTAVDMCQAAGYSPSLPSMMVARARRSGFILDAKRKYREPWRYTLVEIKVPHMYAR